MEGDTRRYGSIGWAVDHMVGNERLRRRSWGSSPEWVTYIPKGSAQLPQKFAGGFDTGPFLVALLKNRGLVPWSITQADLLATDWEIANGQTEAAEPFTLP